MTFRNEQIDAVLADLTTVIMMSVAHAFGDPASEKFQELAKEIGDKIEIARPHLLEAHLQHTAVKAVRETADFQRHVLRRIEKDGFEKRSSTHGMLIESVMRADANELLIQTLIRSEKESML